MVRVMVRALGYAALLPSLTAPHQAAADKEKAEADAAAEALGVAERKLAEARLEQY